MASIPSALQYSQPNFRGNVIAVDPALTALRQQRRADRRDFLENFDHGLQTLFADFNEAKENEDQDLKFQARRAIEICVLVAIDTFSGHLSLKENTKEDVEHISLRLLGMVTCFGWEAYDKVIDLIREEYNWRQAAGGSRWELPDSVRCKGIEVASKRKIFESPKLDSVAVVPTGIRRQGKTQRDRESGATARHAENRKRQADINRKRALGQDSNKKKER